MAWAWTQARGPGRGPSCTVFSLSLSSGEEAKWASLCQPRAVCTSQNVPASGGDLPRPLYRGTAGFHGRGVFLGSSSRGLFMEMSTQDCARCLPRPGKPRSGREELTPRAAPAHARGGCGFCPAVREGRVPPTSHAHGHDTMTGEEAPS